MRPWTDILKLAVRAPSPHNVQPWKVRVEDNRKALVLLDMSRVLPREDTTGSFILSGMVMFIEAIRIAAADKGFKLRVRYLTLKGKSGLVPFADLMLTTGRAPNLYPAVLLSKRRTSRLPHLDRAVPGVAQAALTKLAERHGQRYGFITETSRIERILDRNISALFHDLNTPDYHDEIVEWFRFSGADTRKTRDGLDYRCMNLGALEYRLSARFPGLLKLPGLSGFFHRRYRRTLGNTVCVGYVSGPFWSPKAAYRAGKFLLHFWLEITRHGLYIHPFGNLITNRPARAWLERELGVRNLWFVFRIGYTNAPGASARRSVTEICHA